MRIVLNKDLSVDKEKTRDGTVLDARADGSVVILLHGEVYNFDSQEELDECISTCMYAW